MSKISEKTFIEMHNDYKNRLFIFAKKIIKDDLLAEDCVQQTFYELYKLDYYEKISEKIHSWLFTVCRNHAFKTFNKRKRFPVCEDREDDRIDEDLSPFENLDRKELYVIINKHLKNLSKQKQDMIMLRFFSGLSYEEISKKTNSTIQTVGFHLSNSLTIIRKKFHESVDMRTK